LWQIRKRRAVYCARYGDQRHRSRLQRLILERRLKVHDAFTVADKDIFLVLRLGCRQVRHYKRYVVFGRIVRNRYSCDIDSMLQAQVLFSLFKC